ncbi:phage tail fiber C-terminal domain-containing protein, partial [Escherichia coli]
GALITGLTFLDPKDATRVQGFFQHLQVRFGDGPWQDEPPRVSWRVFYL